VFINTNLAWPQDILFLEDQQVVLISNYNTGRITKYNSSTGDYIGNFATEVAGPTRMKIGADSLLYVLQAAGNGRVRRYRLDGIFVDEFTNIGVVQSIGIDWDSNGNLYVSSYNGDFVRKFDADGNDLGIFINTNLLGPTNIWFDKNGDLLVLDFDGTSVKRFNSDGNFLNNFITGLSGAEGVAFLSNGNILIGNAATSSVKMFDSSGNYIEDFIWSGAGNLITPNAIVIRETNPSSVSGDENYSNLNNFVLEQNYPNPFNPTTNIRFRIADHGFATLNVYNILGNEIAILVGEELAAGEHEITFDASNLPSGIYFYQLKVGSFVQTNKMTLLK
ncbi:MAG TPA: T9SS type A sorting domain-containing protein, partial [Ignavibacteriaceae bacterium]